MRPLGLSFTFGLPPKCQGTIGESPRPWYWVESVLREVPGRPAYVRPTGLTGSGRWFFRRRNFSVRTPNWVIQVSILIISMSSSTWQCQIWNLTMFVVVSSYIHVSQSLHMLHLVLFLAYSEHNLTKHLKPPKLVEFVSLKQIMHKNMFIPTLITEKLVVDVVINDHQHQLFQGTSPLTHSTLLSLSRSLRVK